VVNKALFLDRDGVINQLVVDKDKLRSPRLMEEFRYEPGLIEFIEKVRELSFQIIVITNQPEVKRGLVAKEMVEKFHQQIFQDTEIKDFFVCWHDIEDNCNCRKPRPGLLLDAKKDLNISMKNSYMIGDRNIDMLAAKRAGCTGLLYARDYHDERNTGQPSFKSFSEILSHINLILKS